MNVGSTNVHDLLQHVEQTLRYVASRSICLSPASEATGIHLDTSYTDGPVLAMENILQRLVVLQPFICADIPEINQVLHHVSGPL